MRFFQQFSFECPQKFPEEIDGYKITKWVNNKAAIYKKSLFNYLVLKKKDPVWYGNEDGYYRDAGYIGGIYCSFWGKAERVFYVYSK